MKINKGITLIALVITIVVLIILAGVAINLSLGENGIFNKAEQAKESTIKETATEKMNLKIINMQMETYGNKQRMPTLQEFADGLCADREIEYVQLQSKKMAALEKIEVGNANSIFTKLKEYPYEFEINSSLQLASVDGVKVESANTFTGEVIHFNATSKGQASSASSAVLTDTYTFEENGTYIVIANIFMGGGSYNPAGTMSFKVNEEQLQETVINTVSTNLVHYYKFTANKGDILTVNMTSESITQRAYENYMILK